MSSVSMSHSDIISLCRLCLAKDLASIDIFETGSEIRQLFTKIVACLPVQVMRDDSLPTKICEVCNSKVDDFYNFWSSTAKNQKQLNDWLSTATDEDPKTDQPTIKIEADDTRQDTDYENDYDDGGGDHDDSDYDAPNAKRIKINASDVEEDLKPEVDTILSEDLNGDQTPSTSTSKRKKSKDQKSKEKQTIKPSSKPENKSNVENRNTRSSRKQSIDTKLKDTAVKEEPMIGDNSKQEKETNKITKHNKKKVISEDEADSDSYNSDENEILDEEDETKLPENTKYYCRLCNEEFDNKLKRKKHERKSHHTQGLFTCNLCNYVTTHKYYLVKHKSRHIKEFTVFCKKCNLGFLSKNELSVHEIKEHDAAPHACTICKKIFVNKFNLLTHKKLHNPMSRNHQCDTCGKSFTGRNHLKRHMLSVHLKKGAQCKICLKILNSSEALYAHNRIHNNERPFVCPTCGKASRTSSALVVHLRTHTGEKPYKCEFCGKGFTQTSSLAVHRRIHTGQRPHACQICPDKFVTKSLLTHHMNHRHKGIDLSTIVVTQPPPQDEVGIS